MVEWGEEKQRSVFCLEEKEADLGKEILCEQE